MESSTSNVRASTRGPESAGARVPELLGQTVVVIDRDRSAISEGA